MEEEPKNPKTLIPKRAQLPLVFIGVIALLVVLWDTANRMGWVGGPPKAKAVATATKTTSAPGGETTTQTPPPTARATTSPPSAPDTRPSGRPADLDTLRAPARDPMTQLAATTPAQKPPTPTKPSSAPPAPRTGEAPPLPPPMPAPGGTASSFPSPLTTQPQPTPPAVPKPAAPPAPAVHPVPRALARTFPMARRGSVTPAAPPNLALVGTIYGPRGAIAVVHPEDSGRGQYLQPGEALSGGRERVETIGPGKVQISGSGGARELLLRPRPSAPLPKSEAPSKPEEGEESPTPSGKSAGPE